MARLVVTYEKSTVEHRASSYMTIGRSSRCDVRIKDIKLSRIHAEIFQDEDDYILIDLHSQNGTKINGDTVKEAILKDKDVIFLGRARAIFFDDREENDNRSDHTEAPELSNGEPT